jgi:hypothetical protein
MLKTLRDPLWKFAGVIVALLGIIVSRTQGDTSWVIIGLVIVSVILLWILASRNSGGGSRIDVAPGATNGLNRRCIPTNVRHVSRVGLMKDLDLFELTLTSPHTIKYELEHQLLHDTIHLYVDGIEIFRDSFSKIEFGKQVSCSFKIEDLNLLFRFRYMFLTNHARLTSKGQTVLG